MPKQVIDWDLIRLRFEAGQTPYRISEDLGGKPTKQGIANRAKREGWQRKANSLTVAEQLPIVKRAQALTGPTKATADRIAFILELIGSGSSVKLACTAAGVHPRTFKRWCEDDPQLGEQARQARAGKLADWIAHIDRAASRDWKAAKELLTAAPDATDFNQAQHGGITVVLNIDRDNKGAVIDQ